MNLIEQTKEQAIKNILEINGIVRMSLIEMQFIKKVSVSSIFQFICKYNVLFIDIVKGNDECVIRYG